MMGGLPGSGKSTVAEGMARTLGIAILSVDPVDPVEAAMRRAGLSEASTGLAAYAVLEAMADEQLRLGQSVIVDAVNPVEAARQAWRDLADRRGVALRVVVCVCADATLHRRRVEARARGIVGLPELTGADVERRRAQYDPWIDDHLALDTGRLPPDDLIAQAVCYVSNSPR
jgi:predicted kinase